MTQLWFEEQKQKQKQPKRKIELKKEHTESRKQQF